MKTAWLGRCSSLCEDREGTHWDGESDGGGRYGFGSLIYSNDFSTI